MSVIQPLDVEALTGQFRDAQPFPFIQIDDFLDPEFAAEVAASYPEFGEAVADGLAFESVNEHLKVQVTDAEHFPEPVGRLNDALGSPEFLSQLSTITGIENLLVDSTLSGGGMHQTGSRGRLDVHVDFNRLQESGWHRRLNILVYLNPVWERDWGGNVELWDLKVKTCHHSLAPIINRCVIFATSEISNHGVEQVTCPEGMTRKSFAAYYYTVEAPAGWDGASHSTVFHARPSETAKGLIYMPMERLGHRTRECLAGLKGLAKRVLGR